MSGEGRCVEQGGGSVEGGVIRGVSGREADLSLEGMTELTPQACHILFSASLSKSGAEDQKGCERSHMFLANSPSLMIWKQRTRLNQTNLKAGPDVVHQTQPSPDESVSHLAEGEEPRTANKALAGKNLLLNFHANQVTVE